MARYLKEEKTGVGPRVREYRENKGWSQEDLAKRLNMERNTLGMKETGKRTFLPEELLLLSDIFEVTVDELLTGTKTKSWNIHRDLGLNDSAIDAFRSFKKSNPPLMLDWLNDALSFRSVLESIALFMGVPANQDNMRLLETAYIPDANQFHCTMSPDVYDNVISYEIISNLKLARSGDYMEYFTPPMTREQLDIFYQHLRGDQNGEEK